MTEETYEVEEWKLDGVTPQKIRFKHKAEMKQALKNIEDDVDFEIKVKDKKTKMPIVTLVSHQLIQKIKQDLNERKIIFEAEEE